MKRLLLILSGLMLSLPLAAEERELCRIHSDEYRQEVQFRFAEPLVSHTVVENGGREDKDSLSAEELGLDILQISGDSQHPPIPHWRDQDCLVVRFAEGTSCETSFQLKLRPGTRYLGGAVAPDKACNFRCPPDGLRGRPFMDERGLGVMVCAERQTTKESRGLSADSPLRFVFREARRRFVSGKIYYNEQVEAGVEPAYLRQGIGHDSLKVLQNRGESVWKSLQEDSPLPGHVVVRPKKPLDTDKEWHLLLEAGEGFSDCYPVCEYATPEPELGSGVDWVCRDGKTYLRVLFSAPVKAADMPGLFERMVWAVGNVEAQADGNAKKKLVLDGREIEFRYAGIEEVPPVGQMGTFRSRQENPLVYVAPGRARGFAVEVSAAAPVLLDVVLPEDTTSYLGWKMSGSHRHRIALNPAWPELCHGRDMIVPRKGARCLRMPCANLAAVKVSAWRLPYEMTASALGHSLESTARLVADKLEADLLDAREWRGMSVRESELEQREERLKETRAKLRQSAARSRMVLKDAQAYEPHLLQTGKDGMRFQDELVLKLDDVTGGEPAPGMYLLRLEPQPNECVQRALRLNDRAEESLNSHTDVVVQVTDLNVTIAERAIMVNHYSDGSPVQQGSISYQDENQQPHRLVLENGIAWLPEDWRGDCKIVVRAGDDMVMVRMPRSYSSRRGGNGESHSTMLILDRPMYRPGDSVHCRAVLRRQLPDGSCAVPEEKVARVILRRPDGSELESRELSLGEYGALDTTFTLPEGEDDVAGNYEVEVTCGSIRCRQEVACQVFRRDAFKVQLKLEVEPVAPQEYAMKVEAVDYSGTPLAGGKCVLNLGQEEIQLSLDAAGMAEVKRQVTEQQRAAGIIAVRGSVANDREEYVECIPVRKHIFPADFYMELRGDSLFLYDSRTLRPLERTQEVQVRLVDSEEKPEPGPNGLGLMKRHETVCCEKTLLVPAQNWQGTPLPGVEEWTGTPDTILVQGRDAAGRVASLRRAYPRSFAPVSSSELQLAPVENAVDMRLNASRDAVAHVVLTCRKKDRHLTMPVKKGWNTLKLPLLEGEEGSLRVTVVLPRETPAGTATHVSGTCFVPICRYHLAVELGVPQQVCRPAETITLSGRVLAGKTPARAAVTLYAVDAGMLSVGRYERPDPERCFYERSVPGFRLSYNSPEGKASGIPAMHFLPAFWRGDIVGRGYSLSPGNMSDAGFMPLSGRLNGSRYMWGAGALGMVSRKAKRAVANMVDDAMGYEACAPAPCCIVAGDDAEAGSTEGRPPRLRTNFEPVAVWKGALQTQADGSFAVQLTLPDTLTTYRVFAVAVGDDGRRFGSATGEFTVAQPVMLTPGTPLFMSLGDTLRLPLSIVNHTDEPGTWKVTMEGASAAQEITLDARQGGTLYFDFKAAAEGTQQLRWTALGKPGSDAVQGEFMVRFPAPVLKETHRVVLSSGDASLPLASLLGDAVGVASRGRLELVASANPLLHLAGAADFLLEYPYGCTEQRASALIPWLLYDQLAPFCPGMARVSPEEARKVVQESIAELLRRQCQDGGLSYWGGWEHSSLWATAHAAYVLKLAREQGYEVPEESLDRLFRYLWCASANEENYRTRFAIARTRGKTGQMKDILREALEEDEKKDSLHRETRAGVKFMLSMLENPAGADAAFRTWLRTVARDYRHGSTQSNAWNLFALVEYLKLGKEQGGGAALLLQDGSVLELGRGSTTVPLPWQPGQEMKSLPTTLSARNGTVYATLRVRALPPASDYPGVTECGLQVTRLYETRGVDGIWRPASSFKVGDVVRVTLTCAKVADELKYLVLEDYMPACMEAINPQVPGQAAGLEPLEWSFWFDHREYLADRVRGFCTRWAGRDLLNMRYYARVKRAGSSMAPPAQAQLMYEPQIYGLSPNARIISEP